MTTFVTVFDTTSAVPRIDTSRERLERDTAVGLADYMDAGAIVLRTTMQQPDLLSEDPAPRVPSSIRTDGRFVWGDAVSYYVRHHRISPGETFLQHVREQDFLAPDVSRETVAEVASQIRQRRGA